MGSVVSPTGAVGLDSKAPFRRGWLVLTGSVFNILQTVQ